MGIHGDQHALPGRCDKQSSSGPFKSRVCPTDVKTHQPRHTSQDYSFGHARLSVRNSRMGIYRHFYRQETSRYPGDISRGLGILVYYYPRSSHGLLSSLAGKWFKIHMNPVDFYPRLHVILGIIIHNQSII